jgi:hypothetical protein
MIVTSIAGSLAISLAMDVVLARFPSGGPAGSLFSAVLFNATCVVQSVVGAIIEWRRPGHRIGRLLMLSGPLYALLGTIWLTNGSLGALVDPELFRVLSWGVGLLSFPGVALIAGWLPLLYPTGTLPGPRWRIPAGLIVLLSSIGLASQAVRPGPMRAETTITSPIAIDGWPAFLQVFVDAIPLELLAVFFLAVAGLITRYRRGDRVERAQIRWLIAALAITTAGFVSVIVEMALRTDKGPLFSAPVPYVGILAMPITIGIAITRYRLYEIDRLISRTIGWAVVTGVLVAVFAIGVLALQAILAGFAQGQSLAAAASTLIAFALFQPVRRRVQKAVDQRFDRARYDGERTAAAFAEQVRNEVDLLRLRVALVDTVDVAVRPVNATVWLRAGPGVGR